MTCVLPSQPAWLGGRSCNVEANLTCQWTPDNPNHNTTSFDDFGTGFDASMTLWHWLLEINSSFFFSGVACLSIFQSVTLEGWAFIAYHVMNSVSDFAVIYFVLLVIWGTFFFMNLFLASIQGVYAVVHEEEKQHESVMVHCPIYHFKSWFKMKLRLTGGCGGLVGSNHEKATSTSRGLLGALYEMAQATRRDRSTPRLLVLSMGNLDSQEHT
jgi:hypothetical protein